MSSVVPIQLKQSNLQLNLMGGDVDLANFHLQMRNKAGISLTDSIISATVDRVIDGASTLTVQVDDNERRQIQLSGRLGRKVDVEIDGLWWTLVGVKKNGRQLTLTFEEREVNLLRYYSKFMYQDRGQGTRAQFVLKMIQQVTEERLKWVIPELTQKQPISDQLQPGQVFYSSTSGQPLVTSTDPAQQAYNREQNIHYGTKLTVQGAPATKEQIDNANIILGVGQSKGANTKVLISAITTAIDESSLRNISYGTGDSVGLFQQTHYYGSVETRMNPQTSAGMYFDRAIAEDKNYPNEYIKDICQNVQLSGAGGLGTIPRNSSEWGANYARYVDEGAQFVQAWGSEIPQSVKDQLNQAKSDVTQIQQDLSASGAGTGADQAQYYMRGTFQQKNSSWILTLEDSWTCMNRLANEVNWRCFCVSGTIYFISEERLFKSMPFMTISEDTDGIDWIDYDYDEGKRKATVTVTAHLSRWSAPPGSVVQIVDMGIVNGRWLVEEVSRSLYDTIATITLSKPLPKLPEPITLQQLPQNIPVGNPPQPKGASSDTIEIPWSQLSDVQKKVITAAQSQMGVPYQWGGEQSRVGFDCSGLAQWCYNQAGIDIPRTSQTQWAAGPRELEGLQPADLVFFGSDPSGPGHVGIYIGSGAMINAPNTGSVVRIDKNWNPSFGNEPYIGATSPWRR